MTFPSEHILLRVYLRNADRAPHVPTFQRIVQAAHQHGLLGATVMKGILGVGSRGEAKESFWSLSGGAPVIVELLDTPERIDRFMRGPLEQIMVNGMVTLERAAVLRVRRRSESSDAGGVADELKLVSRIAPLSTVPHLQPKTGSDMPAIENKVMLRVFLGESDRFNGRPTYEAIVQKVRELGLAGATVLRGTEGFGAHSVVHKASLLEMSTDMPIVVEIVDSEERINQLLPSLQQMVQGGMITMEYVAILLYRHAEATSPNKVSEQSDAS